MHMYLFSLDENSQHHDYKNDIISTLIASSACRLLDIWARSYTTSKTLHLPTILPQIRRQEQKPSSATTPTDSNTNLCFAKYNIRIRRWTAVNFGTGNDEEDVLRLSYGNPRYVRNRLQACYTKAIKCIKKTKHVCRISEAYPTKNTHQH